MNKCLDFFSKFEVSPFATIFILLTLLTNSYKMFFIYFLITFIHELGHVTVAILFKLRINKIKLLAIGFNAEIDNLDNTTSIKEFFITIAGPLTYFLSFFLLKYLYSIDFVSYNAFTQANIINKYNLFFNLLPIIPLDGGRILKIILDNFFTSKKSISIISLLSFFFTFIFICKTVNSPQWLVYIFLIITNIIYFFTIDKRWKIFLVNRLIMNNKYKIKIHDKKDIYRNKNNIILKNKIMIDEKQAIIGIINNI